MTIFSQYTLQRSVILFGNIFCFICFENFVSSAELIFNTYMMPKYEISPHMKHI